MHSEKSIRLHSYEKRTYSHIKIRQEIRRWRDMRAGIKVINTQTRKRVISKNGLFDKGVGSLTLEV